MTVRRIQHVDLCVADVQRSVAFYLAVLGPLGREEDVRFPTYRGTEEVVYLRFGEDNIGFRPADGGEHRCYDVGLEHRAFEVGTRAEVDEAHRPCVDLGARIHHPPEDDKDVEGYYAVFVFDPDAFRVEVFCAEPAPAEGSRWAPT